MKKIISADEDGELYIAYEFECSLPMRTIQHVTENICINVSFMKSDNVLTVVYVLPKEISTMVITNYISEMEILLHCLKSIEKQIDDCCAGILHYASVIKEIEDFESKESNSSADEIRKDNRQNGKSQKEVVDKKRKLYDATVQKHNSKCS